MLRDMNYRSKISRFFLKNTLWCLVIVTLKMTRIFKHYERRTKQVIIITILSSQHDYKTIFIKHNTNSTYIMHSVLLARIGGESIILRF
jgi:hypothetical protein